MGCLAPQDPGALLDLLGRGVPTVPEGLREQGGLLVVLAQGEHQADRACLAGQATLGSRGSQGDLEGRTPKTT